MLSYGIVTEHLVDDKIGNKITDIATNIKFEIDNYTVRRII